MAEQITTLKANINGTEVVLAPTTNSEYVYMANGANLQYTIDNLPTGGNGNGSSPIDGLLTANEAVLSIGTSVAFNSDGTDLGLLAYGDNIDFSSGGSSRLAIGQNITYNTTSVQNNAVAVGRNIVSSSNTVAIGHDVNARAGTTVAVGYNINSNGISQISIGSMINSLAVANYSVAIGQNARVQGTGAVAIGNNTTAAAQYSVAIGALCTASGINSIRIGANGGVNSNDSMLFGTNGTIVQGSNVTGIGTGITALAQTNTFVLSNQYTTISFPVEPTVGSDMRDKTDIEKLNPIRSLELINSLNPVSYRRNPRLRYLDENGDKKIAGKSYDSTAHEIGEKKNSRIRVGLLAQEVNELINTNFKENEVGDIVHDDMFEFTDEKFRDEYGEGSLSVAYSSLIPHLIASIQTLNNKIDTLENEIKDLRGN